MAFDCNAFAAECPTPIVAVRDDGALSFANRAAATLLGLGLSELATRALSGLIPPRSHPPPGRGWVAHLHGLAAESRPGGAIHPFLHARGSEIEPEWTVLSGHDPAGRDVAVVVLSQRSADFDVAEADRDLEIAQLHRVIFESAPVAIFHTDERAVVTACNERFERLIGSSRRHLIGLVTRTLPNREIVGVIDRALGGERVAWEGDYTSVTGQKTTSIRVVAEPIRNAKGEVVGCVGLVEDVTEQRKARDLAARTERLTSLGTLGRRARGAEPAGVRDREPRARRARARRRRPRERRRDPSVARERARGRGPRRDHRP